MSIAALRIFSVKIKESYFQRPGIKNVDLTLGREYPVIALAEHPESLVDYVLIINDQDELTYIPFGDVKVTHIDSTECPETEKELAIDLFGDKPVENLKTKIDDLKQYCQDMYGLSVDVEISAHYVDNNHVTLDRARQLARDIATELSEDCEDDYLGNGVGQIRCGPLVGTSVRIFYNKTKETPATVTYPTAEE